MMHIVSYLFSLGFYFEMNSASLIILCCSLASSGSVMQNWKRYLDDCLILWSESEENLEKFKDMINNIYHDIQFTSESSNKEIPFLDTLIKRKAQ